MRYVGIENNPYYVYGDNMYLITNTQQPELKININSNSVCYRVVCEAVGMGECLTSHMPTHNNQKQIVRKL